MIAIVFLLGLLAVTVFAAATGAQALPDLDDAPASHPHIGPFEHTLFGVGPNRGAADQQLLGLRRQRRAYSPAG